MKAGAIKGNGIFQFYNPKFACQDIWFQDLKNNDFFGGYFTKKNTPRVNLVYVFDYCMLAKKVYCSPAYRYWLFFTFDSQASNRSVTFFMEPNQNKFCEDLIFVITMKFVTSEWKEDNGLNKQRSKLLAHYSKESFLKKMTEH